MNWIKILILFFYIMKGNSIHCQENNSWVLGAGLNIIDNSGSRFDELLNIKENWNLSKLVKVSVEKRFEYDFGTVLSLSLNQFERGKKINSIMNSESVNYFAIDVMAKNYFSNYWHDPRHAKYDSYLVAGWGGNFFNSVMNNTINIGFGLNIKIKPHTWINFQTIGKFSIDNNTIGNANHLQHSISVVFWLF